MATIDEEISTKKRSRAGIPKDIEVVDIESASFCFTPIKDQGNSKTNAICVEQYSEERDLQLAIKLSTITSDTNFIDLDNYDDGLFLLNFRAPKTDFGKKLEKTKKPFSHLSVTEPGESSNSKTLTKTHLLPAKSASNPSNQTSRSTSKAVLTLTVPIA